MTSMPRIAIYGAGMVGNYLGGRLHGHAQVRFIARPRVAASLGEHGLQVSDLHGRRQHIAPDQLDLHTRPDAARDVDLVLVTVKSAATMDVAHELADVLAPDTPVISFQNGVRNTAELRAALPGRTVLAGMVPFNVTQPQPAHFHQGSSGELIVERSEALAPFAEIFAASQVPLQQHEDMQAVLWAKLLLNLNNPLNALSGLPLRDELAQRPWRQCLALLQHEGLRILDAAGIRPAHLTALPARWLPGVLSMPDALFRRVAARMLAIDPLARSSTWDDLQAGRRTEVDYINGEIVALAKSKGMRAPANQRIVALMRDAERAYEPWQGSSLLRELRSAQSS
jgi:2-dehydropantoate 2-reductase